MTINAYNDRDIDGPQKRSLLNQRSLLGLVLILSIISVLLIIGSIWTFGPNSAILFGALSLSASYVFVRSKFFLNNLWVALANGVVVLSPGIAEKPALGLAIAIVLIILGREILKDILDQEADRGIKYTIPVLYGKTVSAKVALLCYMLALIFLMFYFLGYASIGGIGGFVMVIVFSLVIISSLIPLFNGRDYLFDSKNVYSADIAILLAVVGLSVRI